MKKLIASAALTLGTAGLVGLPATAAFADDDRKVRSGSCSGSSDYRMVLKDVDRDDHLRTIFTINSDKGKGKVWRVTVKRGAKVVHRDTKRTNRNGNVRFAKTFRSDDDRKITVIARAGYGETCKRAMRLDD